MEKDQSAESITFVDYVPIRVRLLLVGLAVIAAMTLAGAMAFQLRANAMSQGIYLYDTVFQSVSYARAAQTDWERLSTMIHGARTLPDDDDLDSFAMAAYGRTAVDAAAFYLKEARANLQVAADSDLTPRMIERCVALMERIKATGGLIGAHIASPKDVESLDTATLLGEMRSVAEGLELFVQDLAADGFRTQEDIAKLVSRGNLMFLGTISTTLVMVVGLSVLFGAQILARLRMVSTFSNRVAEGDLDGVVTVRGRTELTMLMRGLVRMRDAIRTQVTEIDRMRREADTLLGTILPPAIAERLKAGEERIADARAEATIVFLDLSGFTELSRRMGANHLIETLDGIFSALDEAAERHNIQKIKTIGDGYLAAAGVTQPTARDDAARCAAFALEARQAIRTMADSLGYPLDARIGIHNGPVVAGILGKSRLSFDVWGETVNLAARLEASAERGEIRVSEAAYWRLHRQFTLTPLGEVSLKGVGNTTVFVLEEAADETDMQ
ncbi:MAG: adenylate/guanylate cyclase domain-containing protein [Alphaproteobacteria bacterium]